MTYPSACRTGCLDLRPVDPMADLEVLEALFVDAEGWWYDPAGRRRALGRDGPSYWTVRLGEGGQVIGGGGAQRRPGPPTPPARSTTR